jgi:uncharacterized cofD-like protein
MQNPNVVALGGGHGLAATLSALRKVTANITAVVTVADNGGSSGRLREEFKSLPPGDLRMALAALCADDQWGRSWAEIMQYRFTSSGEMNNHALGNLLLTALWDRDGDPVAGIDRVGELLKIVGRVLPMALEPLDIEGEFESNGNISTVRGQIQVATATGNVKSLKLIPENPKATPAALDAIMNANYLTFGPGSWFSSVMPHFLMKEQVGAIAASKAKKVMIFNLQEDAIAGEFAGNSMADHLKLILTHMPALKVDIAIADESMARVGGALSKLVSELGGELVLGDFSHENGKNHHDIDKLASTFAHIFL